MTGEPVDLSDDEEVIDLAAAAAADHPTLALLGTGIMGTGLAHSILRAGLPLRVWNRTAEHAQPLADDGAEVADTIASSVSGADLVVTMLTDADATVSVAEELLEAIDGEALWVQMGTVGLAGIEHLVAMASEHGVALVDAPVSGSKQPAEEGKLMVLAAGDEVLRPRCAPLFDAVGSRTMWVDDTPGAASALKLVINDWLCSLVGALSEALVLSEAIGLDPHAFLAAIDGGALGVPYAGLKGPSMIDRSYPTAFPARLAAKDVALVLDAASANGLDLPLTEAVRDMYRQVLDAGRGDQDMSVLAEALRSQR